MIRSDLPCRAETLDSWIWEDSEDDLREREAILAPGGPALAAVLRELSDESLAVAIRKGFLLKPAFEELFVHRYTPYLARWFFRWGTDAHLAQDLTQQLFLRFYERQLGSYQASDSFRAYLWKAAYHLWVEKVHRARRIHPLDGVPEPRAGGGGPAVEAQTRELEARIEVALRRLPPDQERVLRETMEGRKAGTIAAEMGLTKRAVFMHLFRARRRMEQALAAPADSPGWDERKNGNHDQ
jgi:RNA polymerase sigma factor (sigma-70 family)